MKNLNGVIYVAVCLGLGDRIFCANSICFECSELTDPDECKGFHPCQAGEKCFKEVVETDNGTAEYNWGCASAELCLLENNIAGRRKRMDIERCYECCEGNFCNFGPCVRDYCSKVTCLQGASCRNTALKAVCDCPLGYTGHICETDIDECMSDPCQNGASCSDLIGKYTCTCKPGYNGVNCEIDIDECSSSPCQNGGCVDKVNDYQCVCIPGYTGRNCEININECATAPCQYNSTCVDLVNGYRCKCIPGITGVDCEINIDDCAGVTCQNGGSCLDLIDGFNCKCEYGFDGPFCEHSLGRVCYACEDVVYDVSHCMNRTICGSGEECFMEHELVSPGVFTYSLGCVSTQICSYLESRRSVHPVQLCYECCDTNGCNHHACADTRGLNAGT